MRPLGRWLRFYKSPTQPSHPPLPRNPRAASTPSKTAEPAKNWGLPTLSQGALIASRKRSPFRRRVDRAGCPHFFAPSTGAGCFHAHRYAERNGNTRVDARQLVHRPGWCRDASLHKGQWVTARRWSILGSYKSATFAADERDKLCPCLSLRLLRPPSS